MQNKQETTKNENAEGGEVVKNMQKIEENYECICDATDEVTEDHVKKTMVVTPHDVGLDEETIKNLKEPKEIVDALAKAVTITNPSDKALVIFALKSKAKKIPGFVHTFNDAAKELGKAHAEEVKAVKKGLIANSSDKNVINETDFKDSDGNNFPKLKTHYCVDYEGVHGVTSTPMFVTGVLNYVENSVYVIQLMVNVYSQWILLPISMESLSSRNKFLIYSKHGVDVNPENCDAVIAFIKDMLKLNEFEPQIVVSRLGYNVSGFAPYDAKIKVVPESGYHDVFKAVGASGDLKIAVKHFVEQFNKNENGKLRIGVTSALTSVVAGPLNIPSHIFSYRGLSSTGKTLGAELSTAIFADGNVLNGGYIINGNATDNKLIDMASKLHDFPVVIDELAFSHNQQTVDDLIMKLCAGVDRGRKINGSDVVVQGRWNSTFIVTSERPIVAESSIEGVKNRCIEVFCDRNEPVIKEECIAENLEFINSENHGTIGKAFVETVQAKIADGSLKALYEESYRAASAAAKVKGINNKHAVLAALYLTADKIALESMFANPEMLDDLEPIQPLTAFDIFKYVRSEAEADVPTQAISYVSSEIAMHMKHFVTPNSDDSKTSNTSLWGNYDPETGKVVFVKQALVNMLRRGRFDFSVVKSAWKDMKILQCKDHHYSQSGSVGGVKTQIVTLMLPVADEDEA